MSTRIYTGFRFPKSIRTFQDVQAWHHRVGDVMRAEAQQMLTGFVLNLTLEALDRECLEQAGLLRPEEDAPSLRGQSLLGIGFDQLANRQEKLNKTRQRDPAVDVSAAVVVLADAKGRLYGVAYLDNRKMEKTFWAVSGVEPWGYWNNSDGPEDVSESAWRRRGKVWESLLADKPPSQRGMTLRWVEEIVPLWREHLEAGFDAWWATQDLGRRAKEGAAVIARRNIALPPNATVSEVCDAVRVAEKSVTADDVARVRQVLVPTLTFEDVARLDRECLWATSQNAALSKQHLPTTTATARRPRV